LIKVLQKRIDVNQLMENYAPTMQRSAAVRRAICRNGVSFRPAAAAAAKKGTIFMHEIEFSHQSTL